MAGGGVGAVGGGHGGGGHVHAARHAHTASASGSATTAHGLGHQAHHGKKCGGSEALAWLLMEELKHHHMSVPSSIIAMA